MECQARPGLENELNRDTNQTIFLLTLLYSIQATTNRETPTSFLQDICFHHYQPVLDLGARDPLIGIAEIS